MFDRDNLRDEFDDILCQKRRVAEQLNGLLAAACDPVVRERIAHLQDQAQHHVELAERLVEIVD